MQIALDMGEYDCFRYLKTVQGIELFLVILGRIVPTNTYLPYEGSALRPPPVHCHPFLDHPHVLWTNTTPFYFHIFYLFFDPYLILNHHNHPVVTSFCLSVDPFFLHSFRPPSLHPSFLPSFFSSSLPPSISPSFFLSFFSQLRCQCQLSQVPFEYELKLDKIWCLDDSPSSIFPASALSLTCPSIQQLTPLVLICIRKIFHKLKVIFSFCNISSGLFIVNPFKLKWLKQLGPGGLNSRYYHQLWHSIC